MVKMRDGLTALATTNSITPTLSKQSGIPICRLEMFFSLFFTENVKHIKSRDTRMTSDFDNYHHMANRVSPRL